MPKVIDGAPQDVWEWIYAFEQLAKLKRWNVEAKCLNTTVFHDGDRKYTYEDDAITDDDAVRMEEEFTRSLRKSSVGVT
ncbi:hypothetical protein GN958_ATG01623 [Phytophthora infestans]|uniref:Uncharacterized protein n=1 Tax=Phytophthora infestans TaxID=4787 RepID=A0A8S9VD93_PHYIN|nr:hypothetical protein GN958_ATG01623 [Phytophthora infestans]